MGSGQAGRDLVHPVGAQLALVESVLGKHRDHDLYEQDGEVRCLTCGGAFVCRGHLAKGTRW